MKVFLISGEPTRFRVESSSLECCKCGALFSRLEAKHGSLRVGSECPACRRSAEAQRPPSGEPAGTLDVRLHLVDLAEFHPVGRCTCEHYAYRLGPEAAKLTPYDLEGLTQQQARALRCSHIEAARQAAIDLAVGAHERQRGNAGRREERQP